jgi:hypothetical protein
MKIDSLIKTINYWCKMSTNSYSPNLYQPPGYPSPRFDPSGPPPENSGCIRMPMSFFPPGSSPPTYYQPILINLVDALYV